MPRRLGPISVRLALATVAVAVGAVGLLAVLILVAALGDVTHLARQQQDRAAATTAAVVADAYRAAGSWDGADLEAAAALTAESQASLTVADSTGRSVPIPPVPGAAPPAVLEGAVRSSAVMVDRQRVGTAIVHFYRAALPAADRHLRDALIRRVAVGTGLAAALALGVAVALSRWISKPVVALTAAVRSMEQGDRKVRVGLAGGSGELAALGAAFDRMADTIEREDELRRAVVADVAHELRTPLAILQASAESLADGITAPSQANLSSVHDEVLRLARIVNDLDTLASAEAATLRIERRLVDLSDIAAHTIEALRPAYQEAGVHLGANLAPTPAFADPHRVEQILTNLLTNALKFTEVGGTVTVITASDPDAATLEVADTGIGIPPDELAHVFERFWRGRQAGRLAGSGIGLAVVRALVDAHHGAVTITSTPPEGTRVTVRFPPVAPSAVGRANTGW